MKMFTLPALAALCCLASPVAAAGPAPGGPPSGPPPSEVDSAAESKFDVNLSADSLRAWMKHLTARPHHLGSPYGKESAEFIAGKMKEWGLETTIERYDVLFPTPKSRSLELLGPKPFTALLAEPPIGADATSGQTADQLPIYNAYSADGDVTGELVYVNYGVPDDYKELERRGIDVAGKIVITRYGGSWRGIKPKVAAEHGAIGCIIFSDPGDDGYRAGDVYPEGGWRNEFGAQRGSVADMPIHSGDPLTPSIGATPGAKRLELKDAATLTKIPVLPISYGDAEPLLRAIGGPVAPDAWKGGLPLTYHIGPGPAKVRLAVSFNWDLAPAYDVVGKIRGGERPDQWIIRGNHHDAWAYGALDPVSGLVAMMAEARALGAMAKQGWKPKRTIVYCAWDGEEQGLLGSTEWAEANAAELRKKAVVYINSDATGRGFIYAGGSHTLEKFFNRVAADVKDPQYGISVADRARAAAIVSSSGEERAKYRGGGDLPLDPLGSGSDYTPFLQHLGIAALNVGFGGEDHYGQYHSIYDSYDHYTRFSDTDFSYGVTLAKTCGRAVIRLADADVVPVDFRAFAASVAGYVREVEALAGRMRDEAAELNTKLREKSLVYASDPKEKIAPPKALDEVPFFNFAPLQNAVAALKEKAAAYADRMAKIGASGKPLTADRQTALDAVLMGMERRLTLEKGLEGRPWYTHQVYAPGRYTGYGVKTLPAVREAIELRRWTAVNPEIESAARVLATYTAGIDEALAIINE
jgi:N-acetylated-alpha-linked acidic dipeptidase